jgi:hypothetical protein
VETSFPNKTPTSNAMAESAMETAFVASTTARLVRASGSVSPTIAWTGSAVEMSALALVKRVRRLKKAVDTTAFAAALPMQPTPTMNAIPANATAEALAINRNRNSRMDPLAHWPRNAHRASAPMASVATRRVQACALLVPRRKKVKEPMEPAALSSREPILKTNA